MFLSNPEGVYLLFSRTKRTLAAESYKAFIIYIYLSGMKKMTLVRGPGEEVGDGIGFLLSYYLRYRNTTSRWGRAVEVRKMRLRSYICVEEIVFV